MPGRIGRPPIDNALNHDIKVRVDDDTFNKLIKYCDAVGETKAEVIRKALIQYMKKKTK